MTVNADVGIRSEGTKAEPEVPVKRRQKYIVGNWSLKLEKTLGLKIKIWKSISIVGANQNQGHIMSSREGRPH